MKIRVASALIALTVITPSIFGGTITGITRTPIANAPKFIDSTTAGPDGNVWFLDSTDGAVGRLTPNGDIKLFPLPTANTGPNEIIAGLDGNLWFTERAGFIGRITTSGAVKEFPVGNQLDFPTSIVSGPDGALWFFDHQFPRGGAAANWKIGRMTTDGKLTTYDLGSADAFVTMGIGPDGNLWLYNSTKNTIVKFSTSSGKIAATYSIPSPAGEFQGYINHFVIGPDGNLWFTHGNSIDRVKRDGTITEYAIPTANGIPSALIVGGDGNLWFTEFSSNKLGELIVSSATDSGQATFNESDPVLDAGALNMVPFGGKTTSASADERQALDNQADPCKEQKLAISFTIAGTWVIFRWTVPPQKECANLSVSTSISGPSGGSRSLLFGSQTTLLCFIYNLGPSAAANVVFTCDASGGDMSLRGATLNGASCTFTPTANGVKITAQSLAFRDTCDFHAVLIAAPGENVVTGTAYSDTFDPDMTNNGYQTTWDLDKGRLGAKTNPFPVVPPAPRGPNH
ncbi:MAG TPA: SMP-30/gluconolactonase/LRE family protein [Thermoanaerobaculia bacterium]